MNKKGILYDAIIYIIIFILFFSGMFWFVLSYSDGAVFFGNFYTSEVAFMINQAEQGMKFELDITPLAILASKRNFPIREIISFDNVNNLVLVKTGVNTLTSFSFFNDVDIVNPKIVPPSGSATTTQLFFEIAEKKHND